MRCNKNFMTVNSPPYILYIRNILINDKLTSFQRSAPRQRRHSWSILQFASFILDFFLKFWLFCPKDMSCDHKVSLFKNALLSKFKDMYLGLTFNHFPGVSRHILACDAANSFQFFLFKNRTKPEQNWNDLKKFISCQSLKV